MTLQTVPHLAIATTLSVALHLAALVTYSQYPGGDAGTQAPPGRLVARIRPRISTPPAIPAAPTPRTASPAPKPRKPDSAATPGLATVTPPPAAAVPYFPPAALTRVPILLTEVSPDDWPSTPGAPSGSFQIEVDVGADGRVMQLRSVCEPRMCEAAAIYCGTLWGWRFVPAEILGHRVPSRIQVQFEIGNPADAGFSAEPVPLPQSPTRQ